MVIAFLEEKIIYILTIKKALANVARAFLMVMLAISAQVVAGEARR